MKQLSRCLINITLHNNMSTYVLKIKFKILIYFEKLQNKTWAVLDFWLQAFHASTD